MEWTKENIQKAVNELIEKAGCDLDFRKSLKAEPNKTISDFIDADLPDSFNFNVVDMNDCDMLITLPETKTDEELSDFELEMVAGGKGDSPSKKVCDELSPIATKFISEGTGGVAGEVLGAAGGQTGHDVGYIVGSGFGHILGTVSTGIVTAIQDNF
jgi:hypothetical protein